MVKVKKSTHKGKTHITQKVNVYVTKRGGGSKASGQSRPSPMQQLTGLLAQSIRPPQDINAALLQSERRFSQLLQPLQVAIAAQRPNINVAPPAVNIAQRFPDINVPVNVAPANVNVPVTVQPANVNVPVNVSMPHPREPSTSSGSASAYSRDFVLDQPDAPLVSAVTPLVSGAPKRLDDPHEDVPIEEPSSSSSSGKGESAMPGHIDWERYKSDDELRQLNPTGRTGKMTLERLVAHINRQISDNRLKINFRAGKSVRDKDDLIADILARSMYLVNE